MEAIERIKTLFKVNKDPSFWSHNITESSKLCRTEMDWKHFYAYITNPSGYNPEHIEQMKTLGDLPANETEGCIKPLPEYMVEDVYKNGDETVIHTRNNATSPTSIPTSDDEKNSL
jgi:hypothetical protein